MIGACSFTRASSTTLLLASQAAFFSGIHCGELQGFLFSKALPVDRLERFLAQTPDERGAGTPSRAGALTVG